MDLIRLAYASKRTISLNYDTVKQLIDTARINNKAEDVTGILVNFGPIFFQVLEGPCINVNRIFQRISRDERHEQIQVVYCREIGQRYFPDWSMRSVNLSNDSDQLTKYYLTEKEGFHPHLASHFIIELVARYTKA
ncbi:MAG: BLUF domain-containing protein [Pseudomonadales bacterium]|nr:BLUF domain-containing protein [Pseudomonadales bacterium]